MPSPRLFGTLLALVLAYLALRRLQRQPKRTRKIPESKERVVILGASTEDGLGAAFLQRYLERGTRDVVIVGRRAAALESVRAHVLERTPSKHPDTNVRTFAADCTKIEDVLALRDFVQNELHGLDTLQIVFGVTSILPILGLAGVDPLHVNASGAPSTKLLADRTGLETIAHAVQASSNGNVKGTAIVLGALIPVLQATSVDPVVVGTGSVAGLIAAPTRSIYCATKAAQHFLLESVALECESQTGKLIPGTDKRRAFVRFLILAPGPIKNSFVKQYAVDATTGPRDNRDQALDVKDITAETLASVDANASGLLVLPRTAFVGSLLAQFHTTYVALHPALTQPQQHCAGSAPFVSLLIP